jgi:hypothetical protein
MAARFNKKIETIRDLIDHRLKSVAAVELRDAPAESHVDEDTIAAYIEGRLADDECRPVLAHLAACGICRRASAQIVQLENQIDDEAADAVSAEAEPGRLEALLSRLSSAVSIEEDVVFAYQNPSEEPSDNTDAQDSSSKESADS